MRFRRLCAAVLLAVLVPVPGANAAQVTCEDVYTKAPFGLAGQQTMYGRLCVPAGATKVQVLVPGGTYTSSYWDLAFEPESHSVTRALNKAGIATIAVDRIGTGRSSKPLSVFVNNITQAGAVHQVVRKMHQRFDEVVLGGHSIGSVIAMVEAATYHDVDGVLVTGMTHQWDFIAAVPPLTKMIPVTLDPVLSGRGLDPGYMTTMPGSRYEVFHKPGLLQPAAVNLDESTKDVYAAGEVVTTALLSTLVLPASNAIDVPVMTVQTSADYFCGAPPLGADCSSAEALAASERPFYASAPRLDAFVTTGYGHVFNFAPNAPNYHAAVIEWARSI